MKYRDPISSAGYFLASVYNHPKLALKDTFSGIVSTYGAGAGRGKYFVPARSILGTGLLAIGAIALDPVAAGFGSFELCSTAGHYMEVGEVLRKGGPAPTLPSL